MNHTARTPVGDHRNGLVTEHLYLVQHIVHQLAARYPRHVDRGDLWGAGALGLIDAARRYDPDAGVPFARYAAIRVRGAIIDATRARDWAPRSVRRHTRHETAQRECFEGRHGRPPSAAELAGLLGIDVEELHERRRAAASATLLQLDQPLSEAAPESTFGQQLPEPDAERLPHEALEQRELVGTLRNAVRHLPAAQREVLTRSYFDGELMRDIAASMGVTEARVSQIRSEALNALRAYFATAYDGVVDVAADAPGQRRRAAYVTRLRRQESWRARLAGAVPAGTAA